MPVVRTFAVNAVVAETHGDAGHDAVAGLEVLDGAARGDDDAGAFVRCGAGERGGEFAGGDHAVGVAEGGDGGFEEELGGFEGGGGGDGHFLDGVGFVELGLVSRGGL